MTSKRQVYFAAAILLAAHSLQASNLFVTNILGGQIVEITPSGSSTIFASGLSFPGALAFNDSGDLFEADAGSESIIEFTPGGAGSTFATGVAAQGLSFDSAGNLYVDTGTAIAKFTPDGAETILVSGLPFSDFMGDMPFDALGNLYVTAETAGEVLQITPGGAVNVFASGFNFNPGGELAMDSNGNLYVATYRNGTQREVYKITPGGVASFFTGDNPSGGMAFDSAGALHMASEEGVATVNAQGALVGFATESFVPQGLAFAPTTVVPEPSSLLLLLPTLGVILLRARRRRTA